MGRSFLLLPRSLWPADTAQEQAVTTASSAQ
jgi:hypothetical protein